MNLDDYVFGDRYREATTMDATTTLPATARPCTGGVWGKLFGHRMQPCGELVLAGIERVPGRGAVPRYEREFNVCTRPGCMCIEVVAALRTEGE